MDQALEQNYSKPAKGQGGIIGVTRRKEAVLLHDLIKHEKFQIAQEAVALQGMSTITGLIELLRRLDSINYGQQNIQRPTQVPNSGQYNRRVHWNEKNVQNYSRNDNRNVGENKHGNRERNMNYIEQAKGQKNRNSLNYDEIKVDVHQPRTDF